MLVCFTIGSETRPPRSYVGLLLVLVPFVGVSIAHDLEPSDLAAALVFFVGPWAVGGLVRSRIARSDEAVARAERLERERELEAARAAAEERTRIARELHDIVSHSISVVTIQTQAVRRRLGPEHAAEAADLAAVEATAREALAEMRRLFGVLRADGESVSLAPQPGLAELGRLVEKVGAGDLRVRLSVEGDPVDLPPGRRPRGVPHRPGGADQRGPALGRDRGGRAAALPAHPARHRGGGQRPRPARTTDTPATGWSASASGWRCTTARWTSRGRRPAACCSPPASRCGRPT